MSEELDVVNEDLTNPAETESEIVEESIEEEEVLEEASPAPGSKTDPALLLRSLKEEREKRRLAEEKARELEETISSSETEVYSDEGKALLKEIHSLKSELSEIKGDSTKKDVLIAYPELKDKWTEFEEYRQDPENKGMSLKTSAKAFLVENGIFVKPRKGLEKPTGGDKSPKPTGMTAKDVESLRKNNYRKYLDMLRKGEIPDNLS